MNGKLIFFDIDGTLWDYHNMIPESTKLAIKKLKENGHKTFINTGRSRGFVRNKELLNLGFDGIVSGCGTMIEMNGKTLFCHELAKNVVEDTLNIIRGYGFKPILEGKQYLYMDHEDFDGQSYGEKVMAEMGKDLRSIKDSWNNWEICKLSCDTKDVETSECFKKLEKYYYAIIHNEDVVEFVPNGFSKGTGIKKTCELLGKDIEDTFAFGDSENDLDMLETANIGIAMGNGTEKAKQTANYITDALVDDGIYNACVHYGLI